MKSPRPIVTLTLTSLTLSLVFLSSAAVQAASIVRSEGWSGRLPAPKGLNAAAVTLKRSALNEWIRFEAPAVARRGSLTLSSGTLQLMKGESLNLAISSLTDLFFGAATLTTLESVSVAGIAMFNLEAAGGDILNLAGTNGLQLVAGSLNLPAPDGTIATIDSPVVSGVSTVASAGPGTAVVNQGPVPVPEPSIAVLLGLSSVGLFVRRKRC